MRGDKANAAAALGFDIRGRENTKKLDRNKMKRFYHVFKRFCHVPAIITLIFCAVALLIDWGTIIDFDWIKDSSNAGPNVASSLDNQQREFLMRQYENAIIEIRERLSQENLLFGLKFSLVGAVLALFFTNIGRSGTPQMEPAHSSANLDDLMISPKSAAFFWAALITSSVVDCRILFHCDIITTLGSWIKSSVEPNLLGNNIVGWERFVSSNSLFKLQVYPVLRLNVHLLTLLLFFINVGIFFATPYPSTQPADSTMSALKISRWGGTISFIVFMLTSIHFHYSNFGWRVWCISFTALGIAACFLAGKGKTVDAVSA